MIQIGKYNTLTVSAITDRGVYLEAGEFGEILLPKRYSPLHVEVGDEVNVFIYSDSADRLIATTEQPFAQVGEFASLKVVQVNKMGAFLSWGLSKDLLVPFNQQRKKMELGKHYLVRIYLDQYTNRIAASTKIDKYLDIYPGNYHEGDKVELTIAGHTDLGVKAIINNAHWGLLYRNEIFHPLHIGEKRYGYIKKVRDDGHIDLSLSQTGKAKITDFNEQFLVYLKQHDGQCRFHDKSSPESIKQEFGVSKKTFKATVGNLLKQGKIQLVDHGVTLVSN